MSAPLVVTTKDGTTWTKRGSLRDGRALYAPAEICVCPQYVMVTESELAEIGIAGSADALPMPVADAPEQAAKERDPARRAAWRMLADWRPSGLVDKLNGEAERASYPPALPWAELMDDDDLVQFLDELAAAAIVNADALTALAEVEAACIRWRVIAEAQHAHNTAPGPDADETGGAS